MERDQPQWKIVHVAPEKLRKKIILKIKGKGISYVPGHKKSSCPERKILQP